MSEQNLRVDSGASAGVRPPAERRKIEVGLIRGAIVKARMRTAAIVEVRDTDQSSLAPHRRFS